MFQCEEMTLEHLFFAFVSLWLSGLTWKLWVYRGVIIGLTRDIRALEEAATEPKR